MQVDETRHDHQAAAIDRPVRFFQKARADVRDPIIRKDDVAVATIHVAADTRIVGNNPICFAYQCASHNAHLPKLLVRAAKIGVSSCS